MLNIYVFEQQLEYSFLRSHSCQLWKRIPRSVNENKPSCLLYALNNDDPTFSTSVFERLSDFKCDEVIIGGDYNLVLDVEKDKKGGLAKTHKKSLEVINSYCEDLDLIDVWRIQNPEQRRFTWRQKNPEIQCRLDFFLVSECTSCNSINTDIAPG